MNSSLTTKYFNYQPGFRTNHSTNLCLSFLNDEILKCFDEGLHNSDPSFYRGE